MQTISQTFSADHTIAFDAALRDARTQLPRSADATRADRGLGLALNGHVTLHSDTLAHVTSASGDPDQVYHVHSRNGCDCIDAVRRVEQMPEAAPGVRGCKHYYAAVLMALGHLNLAVKGYTPEADVPIYPAVATGDSGCTWSGYALETPDSGWWFDFGDGSGGFYLSELDLELWDRTPCHVIQWTGDVTRWERWLQGGH